MQEHTITTCCRSVLEFQARLACTFSSASSLLDILSISTEDEKQSNTIPRLHSIGFLHDMYSKPEFDSQVDELRRQIRNNDAIDPLPHLTFDVVQLQEQEER